MIVPDELRTPEMALNEADLKPLLWELQKVLKQWGKEGKIQVVITVSTSGNLPHQQGITFEKRVSIPFNQPV